MKTHMRSFHKKIACEVLRCCSFFSYGECVIPNKELNKSDSYHGHWRDGKIHGFGKYKSVQHFFLAVVKDSSIRTTVVASGAAAVTKMC